MRPRHAVISIVMTALAARVTPAGDNATADRFVIAKADGELTQAQLGHALQGLLRDRFKLVVHRDVKELPVYHSMLARGDGRLGPKLRRSTVDCSDMNQRVEILVVDRAEHPTEN